MPTATLCTISAAPVRRTAASLVLAGLLLAAGLVTAPAALAIDDPSRPDARVTHGPSCRPGGVVVEVTAGTESYAVRLATTRAPDGEDSAEIAPGTTVTLATGDVAWGETIDGWLEYTAPDGSGYVDDLEGYTFTRPAEEDCEALTAPASPATVPPVEPPGLSEVPVVDGDVGPGEDSGESSAGLPSVGALPGPDGGSDVADAPLEQPVGPPASSPGEGSATASGAVVVAEPAAHSSPAPSAPLFAAAVALGLALTTLVAVVRRRAAAVAGRRPAGSA